MSNTAAPKCPPFHTGFVIILSKRTLIPSVLFARLLNAALPSSGRRYCSCPFIMWRETWFCSSCNKHLSDPSTYCVADDWFIGADCDQEQVCVLPKWMSFA